MVRVFPSGLDFNRMTYYRQAHTRSRATTLFLSALALLTLASCADIKPYERGALAHPTMTIADPARPGEAHARDVQEGAVGGGFSAGGGCGCN
jgi:Domain of unknown function (DUF4266)